MMDYAADIVGDIQPAEDLLEEEWTHSVYRRIQYMALTRAPDVVLQEEENKKYTLLATFKGKIDLNPTYEQMLDQGVNWEEGIVNVEATRKHLAETYVNVTNTSYDTLLANLKNDDVLQFPESTFPSGIQKQYRIVRIIERAWYANTPMIVSIYAVVLPEQNS